MSVIMNPIREENFKELDKPAFKELLKELAAGSEEAFGFFKYNDYIITVKRPKAIVNMYKSRRFYRNRKDKGLCVYCGTKVKEVNPKTNAPMRYCVDHRKMESNLKKVRRLEGFLEEEKNEKERAALERKIKALRKEAGQFLIENVTKKSKKSVSENTSSKKTKSIKSTTPRIEKKQKTVSKSKVSKPKKEKVASKTGKIKKVEKAAPKSKAATTIIKEKTIDTRAKTIKTLSKKK